MSDAVLRKSYTVVCQRTSGQSMELEPVSSYGAALSSAKEAITNKRNSEVRIVENKYDQATSKDKKQVIKILKPESAGGSGGTMHRGSARPVVTREVANKATKGIINIVIAVTVLILLAGIMVPLAMR
ncbi:hypothetical protein HED22_02270 [Thalassospira sp. HF15]|uniref:hypothetical protein n=1 Tax=Thalassospira sp. HF15 TaxID=2722755 RepID=UPI00143124BD|nr:hypothetical protein [Thalassospira sp. HF15]NIY74460.1 hypothetical protein [Thalassospira sp. HF15]